MEIYDAVMICEGVVSEPEPTVREAWQLLIDTGVAWQLQGQFGRTASRLIDEGICEPNTKVNLDDVTDHVTTIGYPRDNGNVMVRDGKVVTHGDVDYHEFCRHCRMAKRGHKYVVRYQDDSVLYSKTIDTAIDVSKTSTRSTGKIIPLSDIFTPREVTWISSQ